MLNVLAEGLDFPEGPVVMPDGSVIVTEIRSGTVRRIWGAGRTEIVATPGGGPNGAAIGPDGALYICNNGGIDWTGGGNLDGAEAIGRIERIDLSTGRVERLYDQCDGRPLRAPNDLVFDVDGGIWFTDMGKVRPDSIDRSAVHYCQPDGGTIVAAFRGAMGYNGIGLSPDGASLYVAETPSGRLWRFGIAGPGRLRAGEDGVVRPVWVGSGARDARFDSLAVTGGGTVCVATLVTGGITSIAPDGRSRFVDLPDTIVTNIAFGGADMRTAYITLAGKGMLVALLWDEPGLRLHFGQG